MDNIQTLMIESIQLLLIGMGSVFIILGILIFLISTVSKLLPEEMVEQHFTKPAASNSHNPTDNNELIAVISTAIKAFKKRNPSD